MSKGQPVGQWELHESTSQPGVKYYYNTVTKETSWTTPPTISSTTTPTTPPLPTGKKHSSSIVGHAPAISFALDGDSDVSPPGMRSKKDKRAISRRGGSGAEIPKTHSRAMTDVQISGLSEQKISTPATNVIKFTAKMVVRIISGQDLSSSKASYTCELSLWRLNLGEHVEVVNETVTSAAADGLIPTWNQTFTFGQHVDLASVDMLKIRVFKGSGRHSLFGKKEKGEAILPLVMFSKIETTTKLEPKWHTLQKVHKMKSIRGQMQIAVEWRPAGEFVQGQVSNVQHHGFGALNIDHLPRELKALFKKSGIKKKDLKKNPALVHKILAMYTVEYDNHEEAHADLHAHHTMKEEEVCEEAAAAAAAAAALDIGPGCQAALGRLLYAYDAVEDTELTVDKDEIVTLIGFQDGFYLCRNYKGQEGVVQDDFICELWDLPNGWEEVVDEETGDTYYEHDDGETTWDRPRQEESEEDATRSMTPPPLAPTSFKEETKTSATRSKRKSMPPPGMEDDDDEEEESLPPPPGMEVEVVVAPGEVEVEAPSAPKRILMTGKNTTNDGKKGSSVVTTPRPALPRPTGPRGGPARGGPRGGPARGGPARGGPRGGPARGGPRGGPARGGPRGGPARGGPRGGPRPPRGGLLGQIKKGSSLKKGKPTGPKPARGGFLDSIRKGKALKKRGTSTPPKRTTAPAKSGGFLAEIRKKKALRKVGAQPAKKKPAGKSDIMSQIRNRAIALHPVGDRDAKLGPKLLPKKSHPTMIDHMKEMINNIHMATHGDNGGSDDDSDDSDSDWGDSDDD